MNPIPIIMNLTGLGKVGSTVALIALLLAVSGIAKCSYDASVIADHEAEVKADVIDATSEASTEADAAAVKYDAEFGKRQAQDKKDIDNAKNDQSSPFDGMFD